MEHTSELAWFRAEVVRSLVRPRSFASSLAREHFGLAGVLVALAGGAALSIAIDILVLVAKGISPSGFVNRIVVESFLLGVRVDISVAALALVLYLLARAGRQGSFTLDQSFNAIAFALSPLILAPLAAAIALVDGALLTLAGTAIAIITVRALAGLALNLGAILPLPIAAAALVVVLAAGSLILGDQVSRTRMTGYAVAPQLAPPLDAVPAEGRRYEMDGTSLTVPPDWTHSIRGLPGEVAHFETPSATLNVIRSRPEPLATIDAFASQVARAERLGFTARRDERSVVRIDAVVVVDDRADGAYEARRIALRQFAAVRRSAGIALQFRFFDPPDVDVAFAQAAAIAATWRLTELR